MHVREEDLTDIWLMFKSLKRFQRFRHMSNSSSTHCFSQVKIINRLEVNFEATNMPRKIFSGPYRLVRNPFRCYDGFCMRGLFTLLAQADSLIDKFNVQNWYVSLWNFFWSIQSQIFAALFISTNDWFINQNNFSALTLFSQPIACVWLNHLMIILFTFHMYDSSFWKKISHVTTFFQGISIFPSFVTSVILTVRKIWWTHLLPRSN